MTKYEECIEKLLNEGKISEKRSRELSPLILREVFESGDSIIIHIAGTNGKGSTALFIASILHSAQISYGLFTSPHLFDIRERIQIDNRMISKEDFLECYEYVDEILGQFGIASYSFSERLFMMAMRYFGMKKPKVIILETGLGGRLDATNYIDKKDICVITRIGLDHTEYLGNTLEKIAREKAGIIKNQSPLVFWNDEKYTSGVFEEVCQTNNSACYSIKNGDIFVNSVSEEGIDFSIQSEYYRYDNLKLKSVGLYQTQNAALAILSLKLLKKLNISDRNIYEGLSDMHWPARMDEIRENLWIDGAHNINGIEAFLESAKRIRGDRKYLLFSVFSDKNYEKMVDLILESEIFDMIFVTTIDNKRALTLDELKKIFAKAGEKKVFFYLNSKEALKAMLEKKKASDVCFVAGSLYLAGEIMQNFS